MDEQTRLHEQDLDMIRNLRLFDDDFLKEVFDNNVPATELVLDIILERDDIKVKTVIGQREIKGIEGHSVKLDIMAEDSNGKIYDIEIQREDRAYLPQRARYNSSMMDTVLLKAGEEYSNLVPTYVIFLTEEDAIGDGRPIHHYVMKDVDDNSALGDERHIIFVNGNNKDESTSLGKLIHDFKCTSSEDMYFDELSARVHYFKEEEGGVSQMCKMLEDMVNEAAAQAAQKAAIAATIAATIDVYLEFNMSAQEIKERIISKFDLSEAEALEYMLRKSA